MYRLLKAGGHFLILWMSWLPYEDELAMASEKLVLKHNPNWTGAGFRRYLPSIPEAAKPYFDTANALSYDVKLPFTRETWHGRMLACRGTGASSLPQETIGRFDEEHRAYMQTLPERFEILHCVTLLKLQKKPDCAD